MIDREKVINDLVFATVMTNVNGSEYVALMPQTVSDIIGLLKEQEAVKPYVTGRGESFETAETWWYACGNCHEALDPDDKYCRHCGRQVKWDD